ncbi:uridine kinase family protein [Parasphingorhabdus pacifica]
MAVDGPSGSGKSTFADGLVDRLRAEGVVVGLVRTDDFATWDDPVGWWPRLVEGVLRPLRGGVPGEYRRVEWPEGRPEPGALVTVDVPDVLVLEGVSAARRSVAEWASLVVWVEHVDADVRLERAVARDGAASRPELVRWQEFERSWFAADDPMSRADILIG